MSSCLLTHNASIKDAGKFGHSKKVVRFNWLEKFSEY